MGLDLTFELREDAVYGSFDCGARYQGYPGRLHGGVVATLLDAAMTNWLFLHQVAAYTAALDIRYRHPVLIGTEALIVATLEEENSPLYRMSSRVQQGDQVCATARAKFMMAR